MATTPQIRVRDGSLTTNLVLTTNEDALFIEGVADVVTADIQISVNGATYVSDPGLVKFDLPAFTIPNPATYTSGLILVSGVNTILIRTIDIVGGVSAPASVTITKVRSSDVLAPIPPTALQCRRRRDAVDVMAGRPRVLFRNAPDNFRGFNYYASRTPGGETGYYRINEKLVNTDSVFEEFASNFAENTVMWDAGNPTSVRVRVTEVDEFDVEQSVRLDTTTATGVLNNKIRFSSLLEDVALQPFISFRHFRQGGIGIINEDQFASVAPDEPLFYVVTAVYYDGLTGHEIESPYSQEIVGQPLTIDTTLRGLPVRKIRAVIFDYMAAIQRVNQEISLNVGSTTRDISIDPFASEAERIWFLLDFVFKCDSFLTLLAIDDANNDGISDPVSSSSYKTALKRALGISSDTAVQAVIDGAFEKLAGNLGKPRLPGRPAIGQEVFYTTSKPTKDLPVPAGTIVSSDADPSLGVPSVRFRVGGTYVLPAADAEAYYNFDRRRYELTCDITAETIGEAGNRPAGQIKNAQGVGGLQATNLEATVFGNSRESNADLASRAMLSYYSVDTGTEGGYASRAAGQTGIVKAKIVKSGDALMMRDYDDVRKKHAGGKVDVWVQGMRERQITEKFAFSFEIALDIRCALIDLGTLTFRVLDSRVTPTTPILEVLNNLPAGLGVRNATTGLSYDVTGVVIDDFQTFHLNTSIPQPITHNDDIILADYRFQSANRIYPTWQPIRRIVSVVGEVSGALDSLNGWTLYKTEDPLLEGESTIARNFLTINQVGGLPTGGSISVNAEPHVLIGAVEEPLLSVGINSHTIRVFTKDRSIEYSDPSDALPDWDVVPGTPTTPIKIVRTAGSIIPSGAEVSVDYDKDENFVVTYVINDLLQELQGTIDKGKKGQRDGRHITADVIVKQAIDNDIDVEATVQLKKGAKKENVDPPVRSAISLQLDTKLIGQGSAQADTITAIDDTEGVDYPVVPLTRMAYADGSHRLRESLLSSVTRVASLDMGGSVVYMLANPLKYPTTDGGGLPTEHRGVFQDDVAMTLASDALLVAATSPGAAIIGSTGASILGLSDLATLVSAGFTTTATQQAELLRRTANRVLIAIPTLDSPAGHKYSVSYVIRGDSGSHDLVAADVEFLSLGNLTLTWRAAN